MSVCILTLGLSTASYSQAVPMATRLKQAQVGAGFSFAIPDFGQTYVKGFTIYGDLDLTHRLAIEADMHYDSLDMFSSTGIGEQTYLIGPRFSLLRRDRLNAYAKLLGGVGRFQYKSGYFPDPHTDTFGAFAFGGGIDFRASQHLNIRAIDIEAQRWPGFGTPGRPAHGITPFVTTFGAAYIF